MVRRRRRTVFWVLLVLVVIAVIELLSLATLSVINRSLTAYGHLSAQRASAMLGAGTVVRPPELPERLQAASFRGQHAIHPYVGFVMDPTTHWTAKLPGYDRAAAEFGFPDNTHSLLLVPSDERVVVAVFGGSVALLFARGAGGIELTRLLQEAPGFAGKEVVVLRLGGPGYKQPQQLMILNYLLTQGAHFDIVLNLDGFNEVALPFTEHLPAEVFPHYPRGWYFSVAHLDPTMRKAVGAVTWLLDRRARQAAVFSRLPLRLSLAAGLVWTVLDHRILSDLSRYEQALAEWKEPSDDYQVRGPRTDYRSRKELFRDLAAVWQRSSLLMHRLCAGGGIEYYHVLQPNQYVPGSKPMGRVERERAWSEKHPYRSGVVAGYPFLTEAGAGLLKHGVSFHDLTMIFADVHEPLYTDKCCHFNARGNRILAGEIARLITTARNSVPEVDSP